MNNEKDILETIGKASYRVPEGYFDDLKSRLESIPEGRTVSPGLWMKAKPFLALAASFAAILVIGTAVLRTTSKTQSSDWLNEISYAEMIALTNPDVLYDAYEYEHEDISDEDIINYLIESGATMEQLADAGNLK